MACAAADSVNDFAVLSDRRVLLWYTSIIIIIIVMMGGQSIKNRFHFDTLWGFKSAENTLKTSSREGVLKYFDKVTLAIN